MSDTVTVLVSLGFFGVLVRSSSDAGMSVECVSFDVVTVSSSFEMFNSETKVLISDPLSAESSLFEVCSVLELSPLLSPESFSRVEPSSWFVSVSVA